MKDHTSSTCAGHRGVPVCGRILGVRKCEFAAAGLHRYEHGEQHFSDRVRCCGPIIRLLIHSVSSALQAPLAPVNRLVQQRPKLNE